MKKTGNSRVPKLGFRRGRILDVEKKVRVVIKIVNEYDQEKPQLQIADNPVAPRGRAAQPLRDTRKTN